MRAAVLILVILTAGVVSAQEDWGPAEPLFISLSDICVQWGDYGVSSPSISSNDSLMIFVYWCLTGRGIAYSYYFDGIWQSPSPIADYLIGQDPSGPYFVDHPDSILYFSAYNDTAGYGGFDIWAVHLTGATWIESWNLGPAINTDSDDMSPSMPSDGGRLYFDRDGTMMYSDIIGGEFSEPLALPEIINSSLQESEPRISRDGAKLFFNRGASQFDQEPMLVSRFADGAWQEPVRLNDNINFGMYNPECPMIPGKNYAPSFPADGTTMYFCHFAAVGVYCEPGFGIMVSQLVEGVDDSGPAIPSEISVTAYPNPFNSTIKISVSGNRGSIERMAVYDIAGRRIRTLPTLRESVWDAKDDLGGDVASGFYFLKVSTRGSCLITKITLLR